MRIKMKTISIRNSSTFLNLAVYERIIQAKITTATDLLDLAKKDEHDLVREAYASNPSISQNDLDLAFNSLDIALTIGAAANPEASESQLIKILQTGHSLARLKAASNLSSTKLVFDAALSEHQMLPIIYAALSNTSITTENLDFFLKNSKRFNKNIYTKIVSTDNASSDILAKILDIAIAIDFLSEDLKKMIAAHKNADAKILKKILSFKNSRVREQALLNANIDDEILYTMITTGSLSDKLVVASNPRASERVLMSMFEMVNKRYKFSEEITVRHKILENPNIGDKIILACMLMTSALEFDIELIKLALKNPSISDKLLHFYLNPDNYNNAVTSGISGTPNIQPAIAENILLAAASNPKCKFVWLKNIISCIKDKTLNKESIYIDLCVIASAHPDADPDFFIDMCAMDNPNILKAISTSPYSTEESLLNVLVLRNNDYTMHELELRIKNVLSNKNVTEKICIEVIINNIVDNSRVIETEKLGTYVDLILANENVTSSTLINLCPALKYLAGNHFSIIEKFRKLVEHKNSSTYVLSSVMFNLRILTSQLENLNTIALTNKYATELMVKNILNSMEFEIDSEEDNYLYLTQTSIDLVNESKPLYNWKLVKSMSFSKLDREVGLTEMVTNTIKATEQQLQKAMDINQSLMSNAANNDSVTENTIKNIIQTGQPWMRELQVKSEKATFSCIEEAFKEYQIEEVRVAAISNTLFYDRTFHFNALLDKSDNVKLAAFDRLVIKGDKTFHRYVILNCGALLRKKLAALNTADLLTLAILSKDEDNEVAKLANTTVGNYF